MRKSSKASGFTLIELMVVMAIIATLAGLAAVGIPAYLRQADKTADQANLRHLFGMLQIYQQHYKALPRASGPEFVLAPWTHALVDHTTSDAKIFFCPGTGNQPEPDLSNVTPEDIDYTGPDQTGRRTRLRIQMRNANDYAIVCNKVPAVVEGEEDLSDFPHAAKGINVLFAGGSVRWFDAQDDFGGDPPVIGPESPVELLQHMVPEQ